MLHRRIILNLFFSNWWIYTILAIVCFWAGWSISVFMFSIFALCCLFSKPNFAKLKAEGERMSAEEKK